MTASRAPKQARQAASSAVSLRTERQLLRAGAGRVAGVDEVGRGCLAGPVTVGVAVVTADSGSAPVGLADSKDLTPKQRGLMLPKVQQWAIDYAVGSAEPAEIDQLGIIGGLQLAATRAFDQLTEPAEAAILDGSHDWLSAVVDCQVTPKVKADSSCSSVAAASVLAKCHRDAVMVELADTYPGYGWESNKGYAAAAHVAGLTELGPSDQHRLSWNLPGVSSSVQEELPL